MRPGVAAALLSAVLFGASTPFAKFFLNANASPWLLAGLLYLGAGAGLAALQSVRKLAHRPAGEAPLHRADLPWLAAVILTGGVLGPVLLMAGLAKMPATGAALLLNLEGLATMGIAWVVFRENADRRLLLGAFAILAGAALLSWQGKAVFNEGALLIAAACLCWGIDNNLTRKLSAADPVQIAMLKGLVAGAILPKIPAIPAIFLIGLLGYGVSLVLFVRALRDLGTARAGAYFSLAPFVGALLAVAMLGEPLTPNLLIAGGLMGLGLWLHLAERHEHEHTHEVLEHEHRHSHDAHHQHGHAPGVSPLAPHTHPHRHEKLVHRHAHYPDLHHRPGAQHRHDKTA
jgi:drug/metabolite transporter (DMT)-like permease